ncbi:MAG: hypothetical protein ACI39E_07685 [Acutalibacteraceae bacterium]
MKHQELWNIFAQTGRVEDYLRYRQAVSQSKQTAAQQKKETADGVNGKGTDHTRA